MTSYSRLLDFAGNDDVMQVLRDDGAYVLTGKLAFGGTVYDVANFKDPDGLAYQGWLAAGGVVGAPVPSKTDLTAYATAALQTKFAAGETFNVATSGQPAIPVLCDGTEATRADLGLLALYGQTNPAGTKTWVDNNGVATSLTGAQLVTLTTLAGAWISDCYPVLASVIGGIAAGTIKTKADIDKAFAAVTA